VTETIVQGGRKRACKASISRVRAEVEAEYARELEQAGIWKRARLRWKMEREINRRMKQVAPPDGLY
jgi:hypothetical protein